MMKYLIYLLLPLLIACNSPQKEESKAEEPDSVATEAVTGAVSEPGNDICWKGKLNDKIPVFIHYQIMDNVIAGEITYLNTKRKLPIRLLGSVEENRSYYLLEFDETGNITGTITGTPTVATFEGRGVSPSTGREYEMVLVPFDTIIPSPDITAVKEQIFGTYYYQYGEEGYNGDLVIGKVGDFEAEFEIISLTGIHQGTNMAVVEKDTVPLAGTGFVYKIPESGDCEFRVSFYKDFAHIRYTKGYCTGVFGHNATVEGIFLKIK